MNHSSRASQRGFSLVELMVVVAIIGVLASIAIPSVNKYIAKARQTEAKTNLSSIYTSEKAFYAEYNGYHHMFGVIGFSPEGKMRYNVGFAAATSPATAANGYTTTLPGLPGSAASTLAYCGTAVAMPAGCMLLNGANNGAPLALTAGDVNTTGVAGSTFLVQAIANVFKALPDAWTIDHNKNMTNTTAGIN